MASPNRWEDEQLKERGIDPELCRSVLQNSLPPANHHGLAFTRCLWQMMDQPTWRLLHIGGITTTLVNIHRVPWDIPSCTTKPIPQAISLKILLKMLVSLCGNQLHGGMIERRKKMRERLRKMREILRKMREILRKMRERTMCLSDEPLDIVPMDDHAERLEPPAHFMTGKDRNKCVLLCVAEYEGRMRMKAEQAVAALTANLKEAQQYERVLEEEAGI